MNLLFKMKKLSSLFLLVLLSFDILAQARVIKDENGLIVTEFNYRSQPLLRYKGSIFLKDSVEAGRFSVAGGEEYEKPVLYDILSQSFLADFGIDIIRIRNTDLQIGGRLFRNINGAYYETTYNGKIKILVKYSCALKDFPKGYKDGIPVQVSNDFAGEVVRKKDYFLLFPDNKLRPVNLNRYSVNLALMKNYDGLLYHLQRWEKDITNEKELTDLLDYLDSEGFL
jgi:hypothetical protein